MKKEVLEHNSKMVDVLLKELEEHEKENNKDANLDEKKKATKGFRKKMGEIPMQELNDRDSVIIDPKVEKNKIERNLNMKESKEFSEIKDEFIRRGYSISRKIIYGIEYLLITNYRKICGISIIGCRNNRYDIYNFKYYYEDDEDEGYLKGDMISSCIMYKKQCKRNTLKKVIEYLNDYGDDEFNHFKNYFGVIDNSKNVQLNKYKKELDSLGYKSSIVNYNRPLIYIPNEILLVNKNCITIAIYINKGKLYVSNLDYDYIVETKLFVSFDKITEFTLEQIDKWFFTVEDLLNQKD